MNTFCLAAFLSGYEAVWLLKCERYGVLLVLLWETRELVREERCLTRCVVLVPESQEAVRERSDVLDLESQEAVDGVEGVVGVDNPSGSRGNRNRTP